MIPYGRQDIDEADVAAVLDVLRGDWLTQGPTIERFERAVAEYVGARHAVAYSSGTAALHGACAAAGLGPGDQVATSPLTFMASANCARYVGATPALVDISSESWNLDLSLIPSGTSAVVAVHYAGNPVDLSSPAWAERPKWVIEDAAHALGARTPAGPVGNCANSDMCCFSFHPVKPITTAEGGMVTTNDDELAERLRRFRSHGIVRKPERGSWYYDVEDLGFNYRMTDVHAALGLSQMDRLDTFIARRNEIAHEYRRRLTDMPIVLPPSAPTGSVHGYHLFPVLVPNRAQVFESLREAGIGVQVHYVPVHHHTVSASIQKTPQSLSISEEVYAGLISLPIHPRLTDSDIDSVTHALRVAIESTDGFTPR